MNSSNKKSQGARGIPQPFARQAGHAPQIRPVVAQLKTGMTPPQVKRPVAPPVYRPQPTPKVLQCKAAPVPSPSPPGPKVPTTFHNGPTSLRGFRPLLPVNQKWPNTQTIQRAATAVAATVEEKKPDAAQVLREQRKAEKKAEKAARAVIRAQEEKANEERLDEKKGFYRMNAQQAHVYIQGRSASQISDLKLMPRLFRTYQCTGGGIGGEYMFPKMGHGMREILGQSVIHVHWDGTYNREYGHFKNHIDKTRGGGSLGAIDSAKLDAMNVPAQIDNESFQLLKEN